MQTQFQVGETYKTRNGKDAKIIALRKAKHFALVGLILNSEGGEDIHTWNTEGNVHFIEQHPLDIRIDWQEPNEYKTYNRDDPVWVRQHVNDDWVKRNFDYAEDGVAYCYRGGTNSWTASDSIPWKYCKKK